MDLCGPVGTAVHAFADGEIFLCAYYPEKYDWGHVIITRHQLLARTSRNQRHGVALAGEDQAEEEVEVWALHGHLSARSLEGKAPGHRIRQGDILGWMGVQADNGTY